MMTFRGRTMPFQDVHSKQARKTWYKNWLQNLLLLQAASYIHRVADINDFRRLCTWANFFNILQLNFPFCAFLILCVLLFCAFLLPYWPYGSYSEIPVHSHFVHSWAFCIFGRKIDSAQMDCFYCIDLSVSHPIKSSLRHQRAFNSLPALAWVVVVWTRNGCELSCVKTTRPRWLDKKARGKLSFLSLSHHFTRHRCRISLQAGNPERLQ